MDAAALEGLRDKYVAIQALRRAGASEPRAQMRSLAHRWPGALRELDSLAPSLIEERLEELERCANEAAPVPPWAEILHAYHGWMRLALTLKKAHGRDVESARHWLRESYEPESGQPGLELALDLTASFLRPPGGRLTRWLFDTLAASQGLDATDLERLAFPRASSTTI